jgi:hypothetical protein
MPIKIGFAIVSHNHPEQLLRLVETLTAMFDAPPIACNHNFSVCPLRPEVFPGNVRFVIPHINAKWGHVSIPMAALSALRLLRRYDPPDWFVLLSGSDYPVRSADEIVTELSITHYDVFLDNREILYRAIPPGQTAQDTRFGRPVWLFEHPEWLAEAYSRYCAYRFWLPCPSRARLLSGSFPLRKRHFHIRHPGLIRIIEGFRPRLAACRPSRVYGGDFWFHGNQKAIGRLLDDPSLETLVRYYEKREIPDESIFHTALCNDATLRICADNKRYADWTSRGPHPKWLDFSDVPRMAASGAHFARKFLPDGRVQEYIEKKLLQLS